MTKKLFVLTILLAVAFGFSACKSPAEKAAERSAERAMEKASGGQAEVDIDEDTVNINMEEGSFSAGENVKLPDNFPSDVYIPKGKLLSVMNMGGADNWTATLETDDSISDVVEACQGKLTEAGWEITGNMNLGGMSQLSAEKGERAVSVVFGTEDDKTTIAITVGSN